MGLMDDYSHNVTTARGLHGEDSWRTLILLKWKLWGARYLNQIKYGNANDDFIFFIVV